MITVPDPAALLATLRADGHAGLPDVDVRIGAVGVGQRDRDSSNDSSPGPVILSDGGPYRTPAGPVVDRLARQLGCPVVQLGTGTVRADEETVERAVGRGRGAPAAGLRRVRDAHGHREGDRAAHRQPSRRGPNRLQHQRFHRRPQRPCRRRRETHRPIQVARRPRRRHRHPHRGAVAVEPRWGGRPFDGPQRGRRVAARRPARSRTAVHARPSSTMSLPPIQCSLHSRGPHATPSRRASPIWPGCWRPVDCRWESSVRRHRHRAPSMRFRT